MGYEQNITCTLELTTYCPVEYIRADASDYFSGYAAVYFNGQPDTVYKPLPNVAEHISRNAFDNCLDQNTIATYNHNEDRILGSIETNTLFLETDSRGLKFTIPYDDKDVDHLSVKRKLEKGIIKGCSWQGIGTAVMSRDNNNYIRTINNIEKLIDVSIVNTPAYKGTPVQCGIIRSQIQDLERWEQTIARIKKLRG